MAKESGRVLTDELRRILEEFQHADEQVERFLGERKRLAMVAHRLMHILRMQVRTRDAEEQIGALGLADVIAKLPGLPGRKPAPIEPRRAKRNKRGGARPTRRLRRPQAEASTAMPAPLPAASAAEVLPKGTRITMLEGKYRNWVGTMRWIRVQGARVTYTVDLTGADGQKARTQVTNRSLGKKWSILAATQAKAPEATTPERAPRRRRLGKVETVVVTTPAKAPVPVPAAAPASTARPGRPAKAAKPGRPAKAARLAKAVTPAAPAPLPPGILPKKTPVKMLTGFYLGFTGVIASVQPKPGPKPDAIYTLSLKGPGGQKARTSVKQGSLGRTWLKIG